MRRFFLACAVILGWAALVAARPVHGQGLRVSLGDTSSSLKFSGQERVRGESWSGWGMAPLDDQFGLSRLTLRSDLRLHGWFTAVAEGRSSLASDRTLPGGRRLSDYDQLDVQQLFAQASVPAGGGRLTARGGRFELGFGPGRLASPADWLNVRRAFQGASAEFSRGGVSVQGFWTRPVAVRRYTPNIADSTKEFYGFLLARSTPRTRTELYWLRADITSLTLNGTSGFARLNTFGARAYRAPAGGRFDYDVEAAWQAGSIGAATQRAWMLGSVVGRTVDGPAALRLYAGLDAGSGDNASGGSVQTFYQLFPTGHTFLGYADVHGRQNVIAPTVGASARLLGLGVQLDAFDFSRLSTHDGLYGADGSLNKAGTLGTAAHMGSEIDLTVRRPLLEGRLALQAGASRYFAGAFLHQAVANARDMDFLYAQATVLF